MNIHEYQAKELYRQYGVPTATGYPAMSVDEAVAAAGKLPGPVWVVKAQIHAGGRGKGKFKEADAGDGGGVRLAKSPEEVRAFAEQMLGKTLVTLQTGEAGKQVNRLYIEDGSRIARELYLSALVDRETSRVAFIASTEGGMDIEQVAHDTPEKILTMSIDPACGYQQFHGRKIAFALGPRRPAGQAVREDDRRPLPHGRREGHEPARDQPAGRHRGRRPHLPRRQDGLSTPTPSTGTRRSWNCAISRRGSDGDRSLQA